METEKTYIKGFNDGYRMKEFNPDLFDKLKDGLGAEEPYDRGFIDGAEQAEKEIEKSRLKELETIRGSNEPEQEQNIEH